MLEKKEELPSEISDNANEALTKYIGRNGFPGESFADYKNGFFDGYDIASTEPVSVDLENGARAIVSFRQGCMIPLG